MKERGNWERCSASLSQESGVLDWDTAKRILRTSELESEEDLDDDGAVEDVLNANG
jgi:hypothetical protein